MIWNRAMKTSRLRSIREYVDVKGVVEKVAESGLGKRGNLNLSGCGGPSLFTFTVLALKFVYYLDGKKAALTSNTGRY
jgi:hypothetical protein